jgi:sulfite exporter TauE/SafE
MASYGLAGGLAGAIGIVPLRALPAAAGAALPVLLAVVLLVVGIGWRWRVPLPTRVRLAFARWRLAVARRPAWQRGMALGLLTPLIPCGPLYVMLGACLLAGSAWHGAELAMAFALGTVPLLWFAQGSFGWIGLKLGQRNLGIVRRAVALTAAVVLLWRTKALIGDAGMIDCCAGPFRLCLERMNLV